MKAGVYEAKVEDYAVGKTKKGDPMVMVRFQVYNTEGESHTVTWYGTFSSPKSQEITFEALAVCGMKTKNPAELTKGKGSGVLDEKKIVTLTLVSEEWEGKSRIKVKYINSPGGSGFRDKMSQADAAQLFNGLNLGGVAAAAQKKQLVNHAPKLDTEEPIPF